jgi:hypothetical protein
MSYGPTMLVADHPMIALLQVILIDRTLAGDNAIIVGLAASRVAPDKRTKVNATLNHVAGDLGIPGESALLRIGITREYERVRIRQLDSLKGTAAVWKWALRRQGVEGIYMICSAAQVMADLRAR